MARSFGGKKRKIREHFGFFFVDGGVLLVFGRAAWRVADFSAAPSLAELLCNVLMQWLWRVMLRNEENLKGSEP
jgi:hypothetical protein